MTEYGLYRGGTPAGSSATTTGIFSGLACNTNYTLAVDAADAAGNRSGKATVMVSTTACPDTAAPSSPTGLAGIERDAVELDPHLECVDRQRRRRRLRRLQERDEDGVGHVEVVQPDRLDVRDLLLVRRRGSGRRRQPLRPRACECDDHGVCPCSPAASPAERQHPGRFPGAVDRSRDQRFLRRRHGPHQRR